MCLDNTFRFIISPLRMLIFTIVFPSRLQVWFGQSKNILPRSLSLISKCGSSIRNESDGQGACSINIPVEYCCLFQSWGSFLFGLYNFFRQHPVDRIITLPYAYTNLLYYCDRLISTRLANRSGPMENAWLL